MLRPLLSPAQRAQLFAVADDISEQELVRRFTLTASDLAQIQLQREEHNRLGYAVQMAFLRFPGRPMQPGEAIPYPLLTYLAAQLHLSPRVFTLYARRDTTRREHAARIQKYLKLRALTAQDEHVLRKLLLPKAIQTGSNIAVVTALLEEMRAKKIIIPSISTVERVAYSIQEEARRHGLLVAIVSELRKDIIDQTIAMHDKMIGQFFNRSERQQKEAFHKRGKAINEKQSCPICRSLI